MDLVEFPLEYVTGALRLPPFDSWEGGEVQIWISVVNNGGTDGVTRAFGFRRSHTQSFAGSDPGVPVFDSAVDVPMISTTHLPVSGVVPAREHWLFTWIVGPGSDHYWFKIATTSTSLVPGLEFVRVISQDGEDLVQVFARYLPDDFALFHRRARLVPGVMVPEGDLVFE
jgi:hypothetical protein